MKKVFYVIIAVISIGIIACTNKHDVEEEPLQTARSFLPAYNYGDAENFEQMYLAIYDLIEGDSSLLNELNHYSVDWMYEDINDLIDSIGEPTLEHTEFFISLDSIITRYFGISIGNLDTEMSVELDTWRTYINSSYFVDEQDRATMFADQALTEYDMVTLCLECAMHNYLIVDAYSCIMILKDNNNFAIRLPLVKSSYPALSDLPMYTAIEIPIQDIRYLYDEDISSYIEHSLYATACFATLDDMWDYIPDGYQFVTKQECKAAYDDEVAEIEQDYEHEMQNLGSGISAITKLEVILNMRFHSIIVAKLRYWRCLFTADDDNGQGQ